MKKIWVGKLALICFALLFGSAVAMAFFEEGGVAYRVFDFLGPVFLAATILLGVCYLICCLWHVASTRDEWRERRKKKREREVAKYNSPENVAKREAQAKAREAERARKEADKRPVSAVLISTDSKKSGANAVGRAVVGGTLFGAVGAIAGAASGTSKATKATFSVKYASGRTGTETVAIGSSRFNELSALLHK